jgi:hypothetical protein
MIIDAKFSFRCAFQFFEINFLDFQAIEILKLKRQKPESLEEKADP